MKGFTKLVIICAIIIIALLGVRIAKAEPLTDLGEAVIYWQELAITLSAENTALKAEIDRLTKENEILKADVEDAINVMSELKSNVNEMAEQAREAETLRLQADEELTTALGQIKILEDLIKKLSGPRFGALLGATYTKGEYGVLAGLTFSLK